MSWQIIGAYISEVTICNAVTVNGNRYRPMIQEYLLPELRKLDRYVFQQDRATCHTTTESIISRPYEDSQGQLKTKHISL